MAQKVFVVAPARAGAGLFEQVLKLDKSWAASALSNPNAFRKITELKSETKDQQYSHSLNESDFTEANELPAEANGAVEVAYNPRFALQLPFLKRAYPDAKFIYVTRNPLRTVASAAIAWNSGKFVSEPDLHGWWGEKWSFALVPGWADLIGKPVPEIAAKQWAKTVDLALDELSKLESNSWVLASFEALLDNPESEIKRITQALDLEWSASIPEKLAPSPNTINPRGIGKRPVPNGEVFAALSNVSDTVKRLNEARSPITPVEQPMQPPAASLPASKRKKESRPSAGTPFENVHTASFRELLKQAKASIFISTYKTGHIINVRQDDNGLNIDFMKMNKPMGMAFGGNRFAVGLAQSIKTWVNLPTLAEVVEPIGKSDAVFSPRSETFTGDVAIHEMAFGTKPGFEGLWWVNTKFSALCKQELDYSWVPAWRPEWITEFSGDDRCHINGLAMVEGRPKFVTALSQTDEPNGWRQLKGTSGVIVDIESNKVVTSGLSMPHSPRWHNGKLWVLESGKGSIATVDLDSGAVSTIATLPGFTRGLSFIGKYAVIGLSQVRESVFKDLPVTEQTEERACGVWIVDTETGAVAGSLKFKGAIQEIFDVKLVPNTTWATILEPENLTAKAYHLPQSVLANLATRRKTTKQQKPEKNNV